MRIEGRPASTDLKAAVEVPNRPGRGSYETASTRTRIISLKYRFLRTEVKLTEGRDLELRNEQAPNRESPALDPGLLVTAPGPG